ncbi:hypothetical protein HAT86_06910 [Roseovarius gahaiensis]|uniref:Uncharacterized protein n=1 Tax=Roseovarius gahaiensis TaxID=2716691 RepID=A0A967EKE3_9RHOB|nr:hypothetical protein [Roseovarius gahaiensis]NHQ74194.1 hypothetical protein [Roseovarius gahaiensis]
MITTEIKISRQVEQAIETILDAHAQGNNDAQAREYVKRLDLVAAALRREAEDIEALAREEQATVYST